MYTCNTACYMYTHTVPPPSHKYTCMYIRILPLPPSHTQITCTHFLQPVPTVAVYIEVDDAKGTEFIPLEPITPHESKPPMESLETSPLIEPRSSASKQKGKPQRERASSKLIVDVSGICTWE